MDIGVVNRYDADIACYRCNVDTVLISMQYWYRIRYHVVVGVVDRCDVDAYRYCVLLSVQCQYRQIRYHIRFHIRYRADVDVVDRWDVDAYRYCLLSAQCHCFDIYIVSDTRWTSIVHRCDRCIPILFCLSFCYRWSIDIVLI